MKGCYANFFLRFLLGMEDYNAKVRITIGFV
jgi:hypothetical protein